MAFNVTIPNFLIFEIIDGASSNMNFGTFLNCFKLNNEFNFLAFKSASGTAFSIIHFRLQIISGFKPLDFKKSTSS